MGRSGVAVAGAIVAAWLCASGCVEKGDTNVKAVSTGGAGGGGGAGGADSGGAGQGCSTEVEFGGKLCFATPEKIATTPPASAMTTADIDADGKVDLVFADMVSNSIGVMRNLGGRKFAPSVQYSTPGPKTIVAADYSGDGLPDLVVGGNMDITTIASSGGGQLGSPATHAIPTQFPRPSLADLDGDKDLDIVTAYDVIPNLGGGSFAFAPTGGGGSGGGGGSANGGGKLCPCGFSPPSTTWVPQVADFDHDGRLDVVNVGNVGNGTQLLRNLGGGSFSAPVQVGTLAEVWGFVVADFDNDGNSDVASASAQPRTVEVSRGTGTGAFLPPLKVGAVTMPTTLAAGDLDGDGDVDLVAGSEHLSQLVVLLNDGLGSFAASLPYAVDSPVLAASVNDFDGDGLADVVAAAPYYGLLMLWGSKP